MQIQTFEEIVCQSIMDRFPDADLNEKVVNGSKVFQITQLGNLVIVIDRIGAEFHFPTNKYPTMRWSDIMEGGPGGVAQMILMDMADAGFQVFYEHGKLIEKSQIWIGRFTFCPKCNEMGKVKEILYGMPSEDYDQEKYVLGGCRVDSEGKDPEISCTNCDWSGQLEEVRFIRRKISQIRFDDGKFDSYTLTLGEGSLELVCYLLITLPAHPGTVCKHTISGEKITQFLQAAGVEDLAGFEKKANQLDSEGWRGLHHQVMEYQTDSWSRSETDWDD